MRTKGQVRFEKLLDVALFPKGVPADVLAARNAMKQDENHQKYWEALDTFGKEIARQEGIELHDDHDDPA